MFGPHFFRDRVIGRICKGKESELSCALPHSTADATQYAQFGMNLLPLLHLQGSGCFLARRLWRPSQAYNPARNAFETIIFKNPGYPVTIENCDPGGSKRAEQRLARIRGP